MDNKRGGFRSNQGPRHNNNRHGGGFRSNQAPREMHDAVCAECGAECKVPFKPSQDRPVYCRDCFASHRN